MAKINIELSLDTKQAIVASQQFEKAALRSFSKLKKSINTLKKPFQDLKANYDKIANGITGINQGFELVANKLSRIFGAPIAAAIEQEKSVNDLNTALRLAGDFSEEASRDFQRFATELQRNSIIGDEVSLSFIGLAKSFGLSNKESKDLIQAAVDLSAATGISLESAVKNLGKTYGGLTGELGEVLPQLKSVEKAALESGAAVEFVLKRFGGAGRAQLNTFGGALEASKNSFGDLLESIGELLIKNDLFINAVKGTIDVFSDLADTIRDNSDKINSAFRLIISAGISFFTIFAVSKIGAIVVNLARMAIGFKSLAITVNLARVAVNLLKASLTLGLTIVIDLLIQSMIQLQESTNEAASLFDVFAKKAQILAAEIASFFLDAFSAIATGLGRLGFKGFFDDVAEGLDGASGSVRNFQKEVETDLADLLGNAFAAATDGTKKLSKELRDAQRSYEKVAKRVEEIGKEFKIAGKTQLEVVRDTGFETRQEITKIQRELRTLANKGVYVKPALDQINEVSKRIGIEFKKRALDARKALEKELVDMLSGVNPEITLDLVAELDDLDLIRLVKEAKQKIEDQDTEIQFTFLGEKVKEAKDKFTLFLKTEVEFTSIAKSLTSSIKEGAEGAKKFITDSLTIAVNSIIPGLGEIVGPLLSFFQQTPEVIKEQTKAFIDGLDEAILGLIDGATAFIEALIEKAPDLITSIAKLAPEISIAIAESVPIIVQRFIENAPAIAEAIITAQLKAGEKFVTFWRDLLVRGAEEFARVAGEAIQDAISGVGDFLSGDGGGDIGNALGDFGNAVGDFVGNIGDALGFAHGGIVQGKGGVDTIPARLSAGEMVVDRGLTSQLADFLNSQQMSSDPKMLALLSAIEQKTGGAGGGEVVVNIGGRAIASVLRDELDSGRVLEVS